jgi:hypothetical protein
MTPREKKKTYLLNQRPPFEKQQTCFATSRRPTAVRITNPEATKPPKKRKIDREKGKKAKRMKTKQEKRELTFICH